MVVVVFQSDNVVADQIRRISGHDLSVSGILLKVIAVYEYLKHAVNSSQRYLKFETTGRLSDDLVVETIT